MNAVVITVVVCVPWTLMAYVVVDVIRRRRRRHAAEARLARRYSEGR